MSVHLNADPGGVIGVVGNSPLRGRNPHTKRRRLSLVVAALSTGPLRYSDLGRKIAGVSPKMLTQTLRTLERDGILTRTVTPSVPVRVDYELTELGSSLAQLMTAVKRWAETHFDEVHEARERYDAESA